MPNLRSGERMQRCECEFHSIIRRQKYYICRTYYSEIERHFCPGCLSVLSNRQLVEYSIGDGYTPVNDLTAETLLNIYGEGVKHGR